MLDELKILVADDNDAVLTMLERVLPSLGAKHVRTVFSGAMAVDALRVPGTAYDCVIADVVMESGNRLQSLQAIRTRQLRYARPHMAFLLMSGRRSAELAGLARQLDVSGFLAKPFTPQS